MAVTYRRLNNSSQEQMNLLRFTAWNTVILENDEEFEIGKFFGKLTKNIESDNYDVHYDKEHNKFFIVYDGVSYEAQIDSSVMNKYLLGLQNPITKNLNNLVTLENNHTEKVERQEKIKNIIKNAKNGIINNDEEREIYLNYLLSEQKISLSKIGKYFKNLFKDIFGEIKDIVKIFSDDYCGDVISVPFIAFCMIIVFPVVGFIIDVFIYGSHSLLFAKIGTALPIILVSGKIVFNRIKRLHDYIKNRKLLNTKIKALSNSFTMNFAKKDDYVIDDRSKYFKNSILGYLNSLADKLNFAKSDERKELGEEIKRLLVKYNELVTSNELIDENEIMVKQGLLNEITKLELIINESIKRNHKFMTRYEEQKIIEEKLELSMQDEETGKSYIKKLN